MSALQERTVEISAEYWSAREEHGMTERVAVAQLALALARVEIDATQAAADRSSEAVQANKGKVTSDSP